MLRRARLEHGTILVQVLGVLITRTNDSNMPPRRRRQVDKNFYIGDIVDVGIAAIEFQYTKTV